MFERIAIRYLRSWATKEERKPLVLRGARQVGKTTLVELFAQDFDTYIYLNLEEREKMQNFLLPTIPSKIYWQVSTSRLISSKMRISVL